MAVLLALAALGGDELGVDAQLYRPAAAGEPLLWTPTTTGEAGWAARVVLHHAVDPLLYESAAGERERVLGGVTQLDLQAAWTHGRIRAAVDLPLALTTSERYPTSAGLGDLWIEARGTALERATSRPGVAVLVGMGLPTTTAGPGLSTGGASGMVGLGVDGRAGPVLVAGSVSLELSPEAELEDLTVGDALLGRLGAGWTLGPDTGLSLEVAGQASVHGLGTAGSVPVELLAGGWFPAGRHLVARVGLGGGLTPGVGSPAGRLVVSLGRAPVDPDPDGDGLPTSTDVCPYEAESPNGVRDMDGCPEHVLVLASAGEAGEGVALVIPPIPAWTDEDGDGVGLHQDVCPDEVEDLDGFEDHDGCPEPDDDGDGILDAEDHCPRVAENHDDFRDEDGCPDSSARERLDFAAGIRFETASDLLRPRSRTVLEKVYALLREYPESLLQVHGHTDGEGEVADNLDLSRRRALAVRTWLTMRGIDGARVRTAGFGESRPIDTNDTPEGRARNRRVEVTLIHVEAP